MVIETIRRFCHFQSRFPRIVPSDLISAQVQGHPKSDKSIRASLDYQSFQICTHFNRSIASNNKDKFELEHVHEIRVQWTYVSEVSVYGSVSVMYAGFREFCKVVQLGTVV